MSLTNNIFSPIYEHEKVTGYQDDCYGIGTTIPLYHLSNELLKDGDKIKPRVPLKEAQLEDSYILRFCMSTSIEGALKAINPNVNDDLYVYKYRLPIGLEMTRLLTGENTKIDYTVVKPTMIGVMDSAITGEVWVMNSDLVIGKDIILCGKVHVISKIYNDDIIDMYYVNSAMHNTKIKSYTRPTGYSYDGYTIPEIFYNYEPLVQKRYIWKIEKNNNCLYFERIIRNQRIINGKVNNDYHDPSNNSIDIDCIYERKFIPEYTPNVNDIIDDITDNIILCKELILYNLRIPNNKEKEEQLRQWWSNQLGFNSK